MQGNEKNQIPTDQGSMYPSNQAPWGRGLRGALSSRRHDGSLRHGFAPCSFSGPRRKGEAVDRLVVLGGSCRSVCRTSLPGLPHRDRPCTTPDMPRSCNPLAKNDCMAERHSSCRWRWDGWHSPPGCRRAARGHRAGTAPACSAGGHTADIRQSCLDQRLEKPFCIAKVLSSLRQWKD